MRAVVVRSPGGPEVLRVAEVPRPEPGPGEVLVRVRAAGTNPIDCAARAGELPAVPEIPGHDVAGTVVAVGGGVADLREGEHVLGMLDDRAGGYAEYVAAPAALLARAPAALGAEAAGALPLAGLTAWQMLVEVAAVGPGQRVLVHAAAGGVGHLAVQVAKARGAHVIGTARAAHHPFLRELGVDEPIDHTATDFATAVSGVDTVLNLVGGPYIGRSLRVLRPGGVLVTVRSAGYEAELAAARDVRVERFLVRPDRGGLAELVELAARGRLRIVLQDVLPLAEAGHAHRLLETGRTRGKIVLVP